MTGDLEVDLRVQAIVVIDEMGSEHGSGEMARRWCGYHVRAVYLPAYATLCVEQTISPPGRTKDEVTRFAEVVADHGAAVRAAIAFADCAKKTAAARATETT